MFTTITTSVRVIKTAVQSLKEEGQGNQKLIGLSSDIYKIRHFTVSKVEIIKK